MFAGPVRGLADVHLGLPDDLRDLGVGVPEHLAEHEDRALGRGQGLQYDQDRHGHGVGEFGFLGDVGRGQEGFGEPGSDVRLADDLGRPEPVQAQVGDGAHQVGPGVLDLRAVGAVPGEPRVLHDVLGVGDAAQHAVGRTEHQAPVLLEIVTHDHHGVIDGP